MATTRWRRRDRGLETGRRRSEKLSRVAPAEIAQMSREAVQALVHELQTHQTELEQQVAERTATQVMLNDVASMANATNELAKAIEYALKRISHHNGWIFGHAWLPSETDPDELVPVHAWYGDALPRYNALRQQIQRTRLRRGEGIAGRAFATGKAVFTADAEADLSSKKSPRIRRSGIQSAGAFPILANDKPLGVLEFFSEHHIKDTEQLLSVMESIGMLLGRVAEREQAALRLRASEERHRAVLDAAGDGIMLLDSNGIIANVNPATERIFGHAADELIGIDASLLIPSLHREEARGCLTEFLQNPELHRLGKGHELMAQRKDGAVFPIEVRINEIPGANMFVSVIHDVSERKALEKEVVDATANEQRRIGQDIHDGVGQELAGLRYVAQTHAEVLMKQGTPEAKTAERMAQWLETIQQQLRTIIRELIPVELDQQGLIAAFHGLAERMTQSHDLVCTFECDQPIVVQDAALATHLYRIVQEAVANAARHAQATHVVIRLQEDSEMLKLQVTDDGIGIGARADDTSGIGLRTMAYRVGLIGGRLRIGELESGGTNVTCVVPKWFSDAGKAES